MSADRQTSDATSPTPDTEAEGAKESRSPDEIRAEIQDTQAELGDTVEALAAKTDVKAQARQRVDEVKGNVQAKREEFTDKARDATPDSARQGGQQVLAKIRENPAPAAMAGAIALGIIIGRLTSSR
jgi:ElaB/YqjD/DUF883 family membrane-anchored ribosome-binding protein